MKHQAMYYKCQNVWICKTKSIKDKAQKKKKKQLGKKLQLDIMNINQWNQ